MHGFDHAFGKFDLKRHAMGLEVVVIDHGLSRGGAGGCHGVRRFGASSNPSCRCDGIKDVHQKAVVTTLNRFLQDKRFAPAWVRPDAMGSKLWTFKAMAISAQTCACVTLASQSITFG